MKTPKLRHMTCCVCGNSAGRWQQHWNRDTGFGICSRCARDEAKRLDPDEHANHYGVEGVNYTTDERAFGTSAGSPRTQ